MGQLFLQYLSTPRVYTCVGCDSHLSSPSEIISKSFHGAHGRAYLFQKVVNVFEGEPMERMMTTGLHEVMDVHCLRCHTVLGWRYVSQPEAIFRSIAALQGRQVHPREIIDSRALHRRMIKSSAFQSRWFSVHSMSSVFQSECCCGYSISTSQVDSVFQSAQLSLLTFCECCISGALCAFHGSASHRPCVPLRMPVLHILAASWLLDRVAWQTPALAIMRYMPPFLGG